MASVTNPKASSEVLPYGPRPQWIGTGPIGSAGDCEMPGHFRTIFPDGQHKDDFWRCDSSNPDKCEPCSVRYRKRVRRLAYRGFLLPGQLWMLTLTAPGSGGCKSWCPCLANKLETDEDLARWNGRCSRKWNDFVTDLRRHYVQVEYFKAVEVQDRGAIHFHVTIRATGQQKRKLSLSALRKLAIHHGFGHAIDLQDIKPGDTKAAGYVTKYVTKAASDRQDVPFTHPETGELEAPWRSPLWTQSRDYGTTMAALKKSQAAWCQQQAALAAETQSGPAEGGPALGSTESDPLDLKTCSYATAIEPPAKVRHQLT